MIGAVPTLAQTRTTRTLAVPDKAIVVRATPHPGQREVHEDPARFKVLAAGRRWGKTRLGVLECLDAACAGKRAWWVAPTFRVSEAGWRPLKQIGMMIPGVNVRLGDRLVEFPGGGTVAVRSSETEGSLRSEGLDFLVMDEAAYQRKSAWTAELRPALADRKGRALFISTPNGRNWFWDIFVRGGEETGDWKSFTYPTTSNPYIDPAEVEAARLDLPDLIYRQEFLAEFVDMEGSVFRRVQEAAVLQQIEAPEPGARYISAVDPAATVDYTVHTVWDTEAACCVHIDRFSRVDYQVLEDRLVAVYNRFGCSNMTLETNSIGQAVIDHLYTRGVDVIPFTTTNATKHEIITKLQSAFEHGRIKIVKDDTTLAELLSFEAHRNKSGTWTYAAPEGLHDDTVMSLAMGWNAIDRAPLIVFGA